MKYSYLSVLLIGSSVLYGCGTANNFLSEKHETVEYYRIFDIKTDATRKVISKAASDGLGRDTGSAQEAMPIPDFTTPPQEPGRFKLVNPFAGSNLAVLAGGVGNLGIRIATCDGAIWTAKAVRRVAGDSTVNVSACLFQYKEGYNLDLYATFTKHEGGLDQIGRDMAHDLVGSPEEWTEKTLLDVARSIGIETGAKVTLVDAQPEISGTPWLDKYDK